MRFPLYPWLLGVALIGSGIAQETLSSVQRELDRVEREIQREKELHKAELDRAAEFEKSKARNMTALQEQIKLTEQRTSELQTEIQRTRSQRGAFRARIDQFQSRQKEFSQSLLAQVNETLEHFRQDFPFQREKRVFELEDLAQCLSAGTCQADEGVNRLFAIYLSAVEIGYEVESYAGTYRSTGNEVHEGDYLRLGAALLTFAGHDGKMAAFLTKQDTGWVWVDSGLPDGARQDILHAVKIAQGKVPPELAKLPFRVPARQEVKE